MPTQYILKLGGSDFMNKYAQFIMQYLRFSRQRVNMAAFYVAAPCSVTKFTNDSDVVTANCKFCTLAT
jgi:hypothetical protein